MSVELQNVKKRMNVTGQIRKVTHAMERVAAARLANDRKAMESSQRYTERLTDLLTEISAAADDIDHPLLTDRKTGVAMVVVLGSERGLCGGFNTTLAGAVTELLRRPAIRKAGVVTVGRVIHRKLRRLGLDISGHYAQPSRKQRAAVLDEVADRVLNAFLREQCSTVFVVYSKFVSGLRQVPASWRIAPCPFLPTFASSDRLFEPDAEQLLYRLLPEFVRQMIDYAFLSSLASENAARQTAMSRATRNAGDVLDDLQSRHRRLRQENTTTQMLELMGGRDTG